MARPCVVLLVAAVAAALCGCAHAQRYFADQTLTSSQTIDLSSDVYYIDASGGSVTLTFPDVTLLAGTRIYFKRVDTSILNTVTLAAHSGQQIENASTLSLLAGRGVILHIESVTLKGRIIASYGF